MHEAGPTILVNKCQEIKKLLKEMALIFQNDQKEHLKYLLTQPIKVWTSILGNISSGKILNKSSDDEISQASEALLKLLIDSRKLKLSEKDFHSQMTTQAGMNDDQIQLLWHFLSNESTLDELITSDEYKFRDLEWRLEAKVASRFSHSLPPEPKIVMKFHLDREKSLKHRLTLTEDEHDRSKKELVVETDTNSLVHIIDQLEAARTAVNIKRTGTTSQLPLQ